MKLIITMKCPDALQTAIEEYSNGMEFGNTLSDDEKELIIDTRKEQLYDEAQNWFQYDEIIRIEIDTETKTCTVIPVHRRTK
jgi:hypothetical protein